jgi:hypothetical protein
LGGGGDLAGCCRNLVTWGVVVYPLPAQILETIESHLLADCEVKTGVLTALVEPSTAIVVPEAPDAAARLQCLQENVQNVSATVLALREELHSS